MIYVNECPHKDCQTKMCVYYVLYIDPSRGGSTRGPAFPLSVFISGRCGGVWRTGQKRSAPGGHRRIKANWERLLLGKNWGAAPSCSQVCCLIIKTSHPEVPAEENKLNICSNDVLCFSDTLTVPVWPVTSWLWWEVFGCMRTLCRVLSWSTSSQAAAWSSVWTRSVYSSRSKPLTAFMFQWYWKTNHCVFCDL